ncbi:MAG: S9 family peptidase, partial [Acidobacteria bacterium]|nr:S9 family peptidase [Acidobacteriota bacterium]
GVADASPCAWESDRSSLVCRAVPAGRGSEPARPEAPSGPEIQETTGEKAAARTYQDLLKTAYDEDLFEHYVGARVVRVDVNGKVSPVGKPDLITRAEPSPDGRYLLVEALHRPFSRLVQVGDFGRRVEIWDRDGKKVAELADREPAEQTPIGRDAVPVGPRKHGWRADTDATVYWLEALDGGAPLQPADKRDVLRALDAPFAGSPTDLVTLGYRFDDIAWTADGVGFVTEKWWRTRRERMWMLPLDGGPVELFDRSSEDRYGDPGSLVMTRDARGSRVVMTSDDGKAVYFKGAGASEEGDRPFVDRFAIAAKKPERLWRAAGEEHEYAAYVLGPDRLLTSRETPEEQPNYYVRNLADGKRVQLTHFPHPHPQLKGASQQMLRYRRNDGVELTATLHLPPGYKPSDGPLPMFMWAYPREYKDAAAAAQVSGSPYEFAFVDPRSPLAWLTQGYAILDGPTMPIVGEGTKEPNDTYVQQLVASAKAAVDEVVRLGVADRDRIAIGGHSYGAFMTANLLAHSDLFQAGIAQSGAYNRTLTPFGFQAEERTYWQAPEIYFQMSPFMHADKVNEPILLIHGIADNNSGTFPLQSERFFHALKGHGAKARLVMLPHESHGYVARETLLHLLWEKTVWLDRYVKKGEMSRARQ